MVDKLYHRAICQVLDRSRTLFMIIVPHLRRMRNHALMLLLCTSMVFLYTMCEPEVS